MVNQFNQVVCDLTRIILEDGKCLYPGYVEVKNGQIFRHFSDDPNNQIAPYTYDSSGNIVGKNPAFTEGMLKNRIEFRRIEGPVTAPEGTPEGHYVDMDTMFRASLLKRDILKKLEEASGKEICKECSAPTDSELHAMHTAPKKESPTPPADQTPDTTPANPPLQDNTGNPGAFTENTPEALVKAAEATQDVTVTPALPEAAADAPASGEIVDPLPANPAPSVPGPAAYNKDDFPPDKLEVVSQTWGGEVGKPQA